MGMLGGPFADTPIRWGLTGTVPKEQFEFRGLQVCIGNVTGQVTAAELQKKGLLANCHVNVQQLQDMVEHKNYQSELKYLLSDVHRLDYMAGMITEIAATGNTLVLVDRVSAGKELADRMGDNAVFVSGATKVKDRKEHYDDVAEMDDKIIVATYGVAAVGINIPRIFNLVLIEPGKSFVRVIQSIGRGVRVAKDKDFVQIWDITSSCKFAKRHLTKRKSFYREAEYPFKVNKLDWQARFRQSDFTFLELKK
jgi:superfamily II DNA or RNA helicase